MPDEKDFVIQVAQTLGQVTSELRHLAEGQKANRAAIDQFIIEHRSQHLEDRVLVKEQLADHLKSVQDDRNRRNKVYYGLLATLAGGVITDVVLRVMTELR